MWGHICTNTGQKPLFLLSQFGGLGIAFYEQTGAERKILRKVGTSLIPRSKN